MRIFGIDPGIAGAIAILDEKKIVDVIEDGYMIGEKILRFGKVVIGS